MRTTEETLTGRPTDSPDIEIMRDDLVGVFYEASRPGTEYMFGDSVTALSEEDKGVLVEFEHTAPRRFDLVIGADGVR